MPTATASLEPTSQATRAAPHAPSEPAPPFAPLRKLATWGVVVGTAAWTTFFFGFLIVSALMPGVVPDSWFLEMVRGHPSATLGIAISAVSAFCIVAVLNVLSRDPIVIRFIGFELQGAAGPVVLWVVCFLAMVAGTELLWDNPGVSGG